MNFLRVGLLRNKLHLVKQVGGGLAHMVDHIDLPYFCTGLGLTDTPGEFRLAVRVYSEADIALLHNHAVIGLLLNQVPHLELDIQAMGEVRWQAGNEVGVAAPGDPLGVGAAIRPEEKATGTLGFFARKRIGEAKGFVSCNHVMGSLAGVNVGANIFRATDDPKLIGKLHSVEPLHPDITNFADCAFAEFVDGVDGALEKKLPVDHLAIDAHPAVPLQSMKVAKFGNKTKQTTGKVTVLDFDGFEANYGTQTIRFDNVIEIESTTPGLLGTTNMFCDAGDSGSLVYTDTHQPLGLLFMKSSAGGKQNSGLAFVNPIDAVLEALKVDMIV